MLLSVYFISMPILGFVWQWQRDLVFKGTDTEDCIETNWHYDPVLCELRVLTTPVCNYHQLSLLNILPCISLDLCRIFVCICGSGLLLGCAFVDPFHVIIYPFWELFLIQPGSFLLLYFSNLSKYYPGSHLAAFLDTPISILLSLITPFIAIPPALYFFYKNFSKTQGAYYSSLIFSMFSLCTSPLVKAIFFSLSLLFSASMLIKRVALLRMRFGRRDPSAPFALARRLYHAAAVRVTGATCTSHTAHRLSHDSTPA